jgi:putative phosphoribosyl transferase
MPEVMMHLVGNQLAGQIELPTDSRRLVIFAHGSGSSRHSPRNQAVAKALNDAKIATCLFDLLTLEEEQIDNLTGELRFNIPFLSERLIQVTNWLLTKYQNEGFSYGYFGSSTGAAAALMASVSCRQIQAVVSRGGRPDLAEDYLGRAHAATLLIVGANDPIVIELNTAALSKLSVEKELAIIPTATHLFEEPGTLDQVIELAKQWFLTYL